MKRSFTEYWEISVLGFSVEGGLAHWVRFTTKTKDGDIS